MSVSRALACVFAVLFAVAPAHAQLQPSHALATASQVALAARVPDAGDREPAAVRKDRHPSVVMQSMYALTIGMQAVDAHSTFRALDAGARPGNPLLGRLEERRPAFLAFKAGVAAGLIYAAHGLSTRHKLRAVVALAAINTGYALLARRNYRVAERMYGWR